MSSNLPATMSAETMEAVIAHGDLSKLSGAQRVEYYLAMCEATGVDPRTRPFEFIMLSGKLTLYARKDATEQLRRRQHVAVTITARERMEDVYVVTARAVMPDGRSDESIGAVPIAGLRGEALANAFMKAETKAKRRVTLSICGLGITDESEVETIPSARHVEVDIATGEIVTEAKQLPAPSTAFGAQLITEERGEAIRKIVKGRNRGGDVREYLSGRTLGSLTNDEADVILDALRLGLVIGADPARAAEVRAEEDAELEAIGERLR